MNCPTVPAQTPGSLAPGSHPVPLWNHVRQLGSLALILSAASAMASTAPQIVQHPRSLLAVPGAGYALTVSATGDAPLTYQWRFQGTNLPGQTNALLSLPHVQSQDAGAYQVVVANPGGAVTSLVAIVTVRATNEAGFAPPQGGWAYYYSGDGLDPADTAALDGHWNHDNTSDSWFRDGRGPGNGLPGGLSSTNGILTVEDAVASFSGGTDDNRRLYFLHNFLRDPEVTNAHTLLNDGLTLTFRARLTPPADPLLELTNAPNGLVNATDGRGMFTVHQGRAPNNQTISFSLHRAVEDLTASTTFNFGQAGLHMNNLNGDTPGTTVDPGEGGQINLLPLDPTVFHEFWITIAPNGATAGTHRVSIYLDGQRTPAVFDVTAGVAVDTSTSEPTLTNYLAFGLPSTAQRGALDLDFLAYKPGVHLPAGLSDPVGFAALPADQLDVVPGQTATFTCAITGTPPYFVQWYRDHLAIPGATNLAYTTPPVTAADHGAEFTVVVTNAFSVATSSPPARLTLLAPPTIAAEPQSQTVTNGDAAMFTVATTPPATAYQWYFNTAPIPDATNAAYLIPVATPAHGGHYFVVATNPGGTVTSAVATLTVHTFDFGDAPPPYPSLRADDGARHRLVPGLHLGETVDYEPDATANLTATGDDTTGAADEDGVRWVTPLLAGQPATVEVVASSSGFLDAWLDFNANGAWGDAGESIFASQPLTAGTNLLALAVPPTATAGPTFARFRFSTVGGLSFAGPAADGEVEDYAVTLLPVADLSVQAVAGPDPVAVGSNLTYILTVANAGPSVASAVMLTNILPAGATFLSAVASQGSCSQAGGLVTCALGSLASGASATVTVVVIPTTDGQANSSAAVGSTATDLSLGNNAAASEATVLAPPVITVPPQDLTVTNGSPANFAVTATGAAPLAYQWRFNGADLPGETSSTLTLAAAAPADAGLYSVRVSNAVGSVNSPSATLTVLVPPAITSQPLDRTNAAGSTAAFSVTATGTEPLHFQWYRDGTAPVAGATAATLTLANAQTSDSALYHVVVSNAAGAVTSAPARLTVIEYDFGDAPDPTYPTLLGNHGARHRLVPGLHLGPAVDYEPDASPNSTATGDDAQGAADEDGVRFGAALLVAQTVPLEVIASAPGYLNAWLDFNRNGSWADPGEHIFTNVWLLAGTNPLTLAVPSTAVPGLSFARFRFSSSGGLSFDGEAQDGEVEDYAVALGAAVDLAVSQVAQPPAVATGSNLTYTVTVTNRGPSAATIVTLADALPGGAQFVSATASQGSCSLQEGVLSCALGTITAGSAATVIVVLQPTTAGTLLHTVTLSAEETELAPADNAATLAAVVQDFPAFTLQPFSQTVTNGDTLTLTAAASGTDLDFQWLHLPAGQTGEGTPVPGATSATLVIAHVQPHHAGTYTLRATNLVGAALSAPAEVQVLVRVAITEAPASLVTTQGHTVTLRVSAEGTPPLSYTWFFESQPIEGITGDTLTLADIQPTQAGSYYVHVVNHFSAQTSPPATLTVLVPPQILAPPQNRTVFAGGEATLSVTAQGTGLSYQWLFNGTTPLEGATNAVLVLTNAQKSQSGLYTVRLSNVVGTLTSTPATLTILEADFGDAPDPYPTRLDYNGAYHVLVAGVHLGAAVDFEPDGRADVLAQGDDLDGVNDEDGVTFLAPLRAGQTASVQVVASTTGRLDAWVDWDQNGSWYDFGDQIFASQPLVPGTNTLTFTVAANASPGNTLARFRFSTAGGLQSDGPAPDGEVEDYQVAVLQAADLALSPIQAPGRVALGSTFECLVGVTNLGPSAAAEVRLTNTLPAATRLLSVNTTHGQCSLAEGQLHCALGTLAPGEHALVTLTLEAIRTARLSLSADVTAATYDPTLANNTAGLQTTVFAPAPEFVNPTPIIIPAAALSAQAGPAAPYPSVIHVSGLTAAVHHVTLTLYGLTHTYPADLDLLLVGPNGQAALVMSDAGHAADGVTLTLDDAGPHRLPLSGRLQSQTYYPTNYDGLDPDTLPAPAPPPPYATTLSAFAGTDPNGPWSLYILDDTAGDDGQLAGGWSLTFGTLDPLADLSLTDETTPNPSAPGTNTTCTFRVTNHGPAPATQVLLSNTLPTGATFVSATASPGACAHQAGSVRCDLGTLPPGAQATVQIVLTPLAVGDLVVPATVTALELDLTPANNTATAAAAVAWPVDLAVQASATPAPAVVGSPLTGVLRVTNQEPHEATGVVLTSALPPNVNFVSVTPSQGSCSSANGVVHCALGNLAAGAGAVVEVVFTPLRPGWLTNVANVTALGLEANSADNTGTLALPAIVVAGPFVSSGPVSIAPDGPAAPYPSTLLVTGLTGAVYRLTATLSNLSHPNPADLDILLVGPGGQAAWLMSDAGAGVPVSGLTFTLADAAPAPLPATGPLGAGMFRPTDYDPVSDALPAPAPTGPHAASLTAFLGTDPNGPWSLFVFDDRGLDGGSIGGWSLDIETLEPIADLSVAVSGQPALIATGSNFTCVVSVTNLGPADATGVRLDHTLPPGLGFLSATPSQGACEHTAGVIHCDLGPLLRSAEATVTLVLTPLGAGAWTQALVVAAAELDPRPANNAAAAGIVVEDPPVITQGPQDLAVAKGLTATFTVAATGTPPLSYQWQKDGTDLPGATNAVLVLSNVTLAARGEYVARVSNRVGAVLSPPATLRVLCPPRIWGLADAVIEEDTSTGPLPFLVEDEETPPDALTITVHSTRPSLVPPANVVLGGSGRERTVTVTPAPDQSGVAFIVLTVTDADGMSASEALEVTVLEVNDPPTLSALPDQTMEEDTALVLPVTVGDVETAATHLVVDAVSDNPALLPDSRLVWSGGGSARTLTLQPRTNAYGAATITLSVRDAQGATTTRAFALTVVPVNDPPELSALADQSVLEDTATDWIPFTVGDVETPPAALTLSGASSNPALVPPENIVFAGTGSARAVRVLPATNQFGSAIITVTVNDGGASNALASRSFALTVAPVNDPPLLAGLVDQTMAEDGVLTVPFTVGDAETPADGLTVTAVSDSPDLLLPANVVLGGSGAQRTLTLRPATNAFGDARITVTVQDPDGAAVSASFLLTVAPVNDPPALLGLSNHVMNARTTLTVNFTVADVDSPVTGVAVSAASSDPAKVPASGLVVSGSGAQRTLAITPEWRASGTVTITLTANDGGPSNHLGTASFQLTILPVNEPPVISAIDDQSTPEDTARVIAFTVGDSDDAAELLIVSGVSSNLALVPHANLIFGGSGSNRTVTVLPATNQSGTAVLRLTVTDTEGAAASTVFTLTVDPVNDPPTITPVADQTLAEDTATAALDFTVGDVETPANKLTVTARSSNPALVPEAGLALLGTEAVRTVRVTPAANQSGTATVTLTVRDQGGLAASTSFQVTVTPVNDPPTISDVPNVTMSGNTVLALPVAVGDLETPAGDLILAVTSSNPGLIPADSIALGGNGANRTVTLTPLFNQIGTATITLTVTDGQGGSASDTFVLTVNPAQYPPTITGQPQSQTVSHGQTATFTVVASGSPPLGYQWFFQGAPLAGATTAVLTLTNVQAAQAGLYTARVTNLYGTTRSREATLQVIGPAQAPVISALADRTTNEDEPVAVAFVVQDADTPAHFLTVTASSTNTALLPVTNIIISGVGTNRTALLVPATNQFGQTRVTLVVSDGTRAASNSFLLTVNPVNDAPTLDPIADVGVVAEANTTRALTGISSGAANESQTLSLTVSNDNTALFSTQPAVTYTSPNATATLTFRTGKNRTGTARVTVTVRDNGASNNVFSRTFTVYSRLSGNAAPVISGLSSVSIPEDGSTGPRPFTVGDATTPAGLLTVSAWSSHPALLPASGLVLGGGGSNRTVTCTPLPNQFGTSLVTVTVVDTNFGFASTNFTLTVTPVNDPPTISALADQVMTENTVLGPLAFTVGDVDTPLNQLTVTASSSDQALVPNGNLILGGGGTERALALVPATNRTGSATITVRVSDGQATNATSFTLTVLPFDFPPMLSDVPDQVTAGGTPTRAIPFTIGDAETAAAELAVTAWAANTNLVPADGFEFGGVGSNRTVRITPAPGLTGSTVITLRVTDAAGASVSDEFLLTVTPANVAPTLNPLPDLALLEGAGAQAVALSGISSGTNTESQALTVTAASSNPGLIPTPTVLYSSPGTTGTLQFLPTPGSNGVAVITVTVSDGQAVNGTFTRSFTVTVNGAPRWAPLADVVTWEDTAVTLPLTVSDPETPAEQLVLRGYSSNTNLLAEAGIVFGGSGAARTVTLRPRTNEFGWTLVTLAATDAAGQSRSNSFALVVNPVNDPPTIAPLNDLMLLEDAGPQVVLLSGLSAGPGNEGQTVTVWASSSNPALIPPPVVAHTPGAATGQLQFTPVAEASGSAVITVTVSDGQSDPGPVSVAFTVTVVAVNDPPQISSLPDVTVPEDTAAGPLAFTVGDIESPAEALVVTARSSNARLVPEANLVLSGSGSNWTLTVFPVTNEFGTSEITVTVTDPGGAGVSSAFSLVVQPVNDLPTLDPVADQVTDEDEPLEAVELWLDDVETPLSALALAVESSNPAVARSERFFVFGSGARRLLFAEPETNAFGSTVVTLRLSDGDGGSVTQQFVWTVRPVNDPPVVSPLADVSSLEDVVIGPLAFTLEDVETPAEALTVTVASGDPQVLPPESFLLGGAGRDRTLTIVPATNAWAWEPIPVTLTVTDADGASAQTTFGVFVWFVNDPPELLGLADVTLLEDQPLGPVAFEAHGGDGEAITVTVRSSNQAVLADEALEVRAGLGWLHFLSGQPVRQASGTATLTLTVTDFFGASVTGALQVTVLPVNDAPTLDPLPNVSLAQDAGPQVLALSGISSGAPNEAQALTVTASSSDPAVVPHPTVSYASPASTGSLTLQPVAGVAGLVTITVTVQDDGGTEHGGVDRVTQSFTVRVGLVPEVRIEIARQPTEGGGSAEEVEVSFETLAGQLYRVEFTESLSAPVWQVLAERAGTGTTLRVRDPVMPGTTRFYRLRVSAP